MFHFFLHQLETSLRLSIHLSQFCFHIDPQSLLSDPDICLPKSFLWFLGFFLVCLDCLFSEHVIFSIFLLFGIYCYSYYMLSIQREYTCFYLFCFYNWLHLQVYFSQEENKKWRKGWNKYLLEFHRVLLQVQVHVIPIFLHVWSAFFSNWKFEILAPVFLCYY